MNNRTLEIILKLRDELTAKMKGAEGTLKKFLAEAKKFSRDMSRIGSDISKVGSSFLMFGAAMTGPLLLAFNSAAQYSRSVSNEITRMKTVSDAFQVSVAQALVPVMRQLGTILGKAYQAWESLGEAKQKAIVQTVFITGAFLTMGGVILKVVGGLIKTGGTIIQLLMRLNPIQIAIMLIVGAVILMIEHWEKCRNVVLPILNAIEIGANMVAIGFHKVVAGVVDGIIIMSTKFSDFMKVLAQMPGPQQGVFLKISEGMDQVASKMRSTSVAEHQAIQDMEANISKIFETGTGTLGNLADEAKRKWEELKGFFNTGGGVNIEGLKSSLDEAKAWSDTMTNMARQTAQSMNTALSTFFFDAFTGQLKSAKDYLADFGRAIISVLTQALAKMILIKTIGKAFPGLGQFMHQGGVVYAHQGLLARDEVPIVAQTGERILSRRENREYERNVLGKSGGGSDGGGGVTININPVIQAWDMTDIQRNKGALTAVIGDAIRNNADIRTIIRRYT